MGERTLTSIRGRSSILLSAAVLSLGACAQQRTDEFTYSEKAIILEEMGILNSMDSNNLLIAADSAGPQLIAGDWLAYQCAYAGGYFDDYDWSPFYAVVETSDLN